MVTAKKGDFRCRTLREYTAHVQEGFVVCVYGLIATVWFTSPLILFALQEADYAKLDVFIFFPYLGGAVVWFATKAIFRSLMALRWLAPDRFHLVALVAATLSSWMCATAQIVSFPEPPILLLAIVVIVGVCAAFLNGYLSFVERKVYMRLHVLRVALLDRKEDELCPDRTKRNYERAIKRAEAIYSHFDFCPPWLWSSEPMPTNCPQEMLASYDSAGIKLSGMPNHSKRETKHS